MLRDAAIGWIRSNCTNQRLRADFSRNLDEAISLGVNCSFTIGEGLTREHAPYLLHWFAGELFVIQLTARQAARLGIGPHGVHHACDHESVPDGPPTAPALSLEALNLEPALLRDLRRPIVATCRYRVTGPVPAAIAFRMDFSRGANQGRRTFCTFAYPAVPPTTPGTITLEFEPGRLPPGTILNPVMAVFVRCYAMNARPAQHWRPISNPIAATLELAEDFRQSP